MEYWSLKFEPKSYTFSLISRKKININFRKIYEKYMKFDEKQKIRQNNFCQKHFFKIAKN